jgi:hypothetical protein
MVPETPSPTLGIGHVVTLSSNGSDGHAAAARSGAGVAGAATMRRLATLEIG